MFKAMSVLPVIFRYPLHAAKLEQIPNKNTIVAHVTTTLNAAANLKCAASASAKLKPEFKVHPRSHFKRPSA